MEKRLIGYWLFWKTYLFREGESIEGRGHGRRGVSNRPPAECTMERAISGLLRLRPEPKPRSGAQSTALSRCPEFFKSLFPLRMFNAFIQISKLTMYIIGFISNVNICVLLVSLFLLFYLSLSSFIYIYVYITHISRHTHIF